VQGQIAAAALNMQACDLKGMIGIIPVQSNLFEQDIFKWEFGLSGTLYFAYDQPPPPTHNENKGGGEGGWPPPTPKFPCPKVIILTILNPYLQTNDAG
jgi:hypothetical protein